MVVANVKQDKVSDVLAALQAYQLSIPAPPPPAGSFNHAQAQRGQVLFKAKGCANCHSGPYFTDANERLHLPTASAATDTLYVTRSATGMYRTTPLRRLWQHPPNFHDGSAGLLDDVAEIGSASCRERVCL